MKDYLVLDKFCSRTILNPEQLKLLVLKQTVLGENVLREPEERRLDGCVLDTRSSLAALCS